ncbi:MAG: hypothetical protein K2I22_14630 [Lachnospiraceae bacterium]|nr:hypothetical protein [Lachnospiraceae bacterium]
MEQISLYDKICGSGTILVIEELGQYGSLWTARKICQSIEEKEESFKEFLVTLNTYGMYDMLVVICEIVDIFCSADIQNWFDEQLRQCPDSEMILWMANKFYQKRVTDLQVFDEIYKFLGEFQKESDIILDLSYEQFEYYMWELYDFGFLKKIARSDARNIGVWYPMIYNESNIEKYMYKLEENAFPYLIMCAKDIIEAGSEDKVKEALVRMRIEGYLGELGSVYYPKITCAVNPLIELDPKLVAESDYSEYAQMIQKILEKELGYRLYITNTMTDYLSEMIRIIKYFGGFSYKYSVKAMKVFLPLFYQLCGREEEAISLLIDTTKDFSAGVLIQKEYLLVFYRSLLITKDEKKRQRLIGIFDEIYYDNSGMREFLMVAEHINSFYQKYCMDILERKRLLLEYPKLPWNYKEYELLTRWFSNNLVSRKFELLLNIMKTKSEYQQSKAVNDFMSLFHSLTGHRDGNIRIVPYSGAKILEDDYSWCDFDEIYNFYTEEERLQICVLAEQMEKTIRHMPAFDWQQYYNSIKQKAESFWNVDKDSVLCGKLLTAFRGIQSDPYNKWEFDEIGNVLKKREEGSINNLVAFFLKAYYGEENIHREEVQGLSGNEDKLGEIDILIYQNGSQFAIQEALKIDSINKTKLDDHMNRMLKNYDTQGVPVTCLVIYAYTKQGQKFFAKVEEYLKQYLDSELFNYEIVKELKMEKVNTANICHHEMVYRREEMLQKMHVFTVLM